MSRTLPVLYLYYFIFCINYSITLTLTLMKKSFILIAFLLILYNNAKSQNLSDYLDSYLGENSTPYIQPLGDLFTSNINTGTREWSGIDSTFYLRVRGQVLYSFPSQKMRTFQAVTLNGFEPEQTVEVPTIIGNNEAISVDGVNGTVYVFPVGYNVEYLPMGTPQVTIGGFLHSELSARFFAFPLDGDLGNIQFLGIGGRHDLSHYLNTPFDLSVGYYYHQVKAGEYVNANQHLISAHIGKSARIWSGHLMAGFQASNMNFHYTYTDGETIDEVDLNLKNSNPFIVELSLGLKLAIFGIHVSASYSEFLSTSAGLGLYF